MREIIMLLAQFWLAPLSFLTLDATSKRALVEFGASGFEDQTSAVQWTQGNNAELEAKAAQVVLFGHNAGGWAICHLTCNTRDACLTSGIVMQLGFCDGIQGTQDRRESNKIVWFLQYACGGESVMVLRYLQSLEASILGKHEGDMKNTCAFDYENYH